MAHVVYCTLNSPSNRKRRNPSTLISDCLGKSRRTSAAEVYTQTGQAITLVFVWRKAVL